MQTQYTQTMPEDYYETWERLHKRERRLIRDAAAGRTSWDRWREAARQLREHERAFRCSLTD